ncbi:MAG: hypothetical protein FJ148_24775 [Deltaproteobacteria bacterium]|nr:hypothetical protein [Deltaproteobacteria bacterium]
MRNGAPLLLGLAGILLAATAVAQDDDGSCTYEGRRYASGFAICQAGQIQTCVGGEWQGNGSFCDGSANGASYGVPVLGPGQVRAGYESPTNLPAQNAPLDDGDD